MANTLIFTAPVQVPNLTRAKMGTVNIDDDGGKLEVQINVQGAGGVKQFESPWVLRITNGSADALVVDTAATVIGNSLRSVQLTGAGVAAAFTTAVAAYRGAGSDKRNLLFAALRGISGVVSNPVAEVGALSGTTQAILPTGSES